ncbi:DUF1624 domain-containing protein [Flavihumibacter petaseus]|uniref:Heparan-alpha-glucosaminide N-acetyltransferase catalytic domain-containing protein n=1 Tax=Flavihumibacter petaseus NBRC 106054 TaxID=1220578 RepID=A0A0E9MUU5_9BACT|nr:heparan-alpha-glucosaminide N-acetyltransferase domain-containing protein [Flavihumibacter petaseus]GAO41354.1 hypothetical protein FPE01S_01_03660 [Flavihumibacter petaseus NBRC 106054]
MTPSSQRYHAIDILRGLVMIIMALDHTRDFFHVTALTADPLDPATTTVPLYFTRWITHFCAPIFVFLSGLSAAIASRKRTPAEAGAFLLKRGFWLVLVELVIITLGITFNPFYNFVILQVIWAIGWSMIILGLLVRFAPKLILPVGLLLFLGHNILDFVTLPSEGSVSVLMRILLTASGTVLPLNQTHFIGVFYAILPWTGIMLLGYCLAGLYSPDYDPAKRRRWLYRAGAIVIAAFVIIRGINVYGDPSRWQSFPHAYQSFLSFLNTTKYPPSLLYHCMTIGPGLVLLAFFEQHQNAFTRFGEVYGKVPFFYYVIHFYLIHVITVICFFATGHDASQIADPNSPFLFRPIQYGFSLPVVYLVWMFIVLSLYYPCRWFGEYKRNHQGYWWLSYL